MRIAVIKETIAMTKDETLIEKSNEIYSVHFDFDETWDGLTKTAFFKAGEYVEELALVNDECDIPRKCLETPGLMLKVLVRGVKGDEEISTPWCNTSRILYDISIDIPDPPVPPTPIGEYARLGNEFAEVLEQEYTEEELKGRALPEVVNEVEELVGNTATDEEVENDEEDAI